MTSDKVTDAQVSYPQDMLTSHHYNNRGGQNYLEGYDICASVTLSLVIIHDSFRIIRNHMEMSALSNITTN
jgi:hypothetical protein